MLGNSLRKVLLRDHTGETSSLGEREKSKESALYQCNQTQLKKTEVTCPKSHGNAPQSESTPGIAEQHHFAAVPAINQHTSRQAKHGKREAAQRSYDACLCWRGSQSQNQERKSQL